MSEKSIGHLTFQPPAMEPKFHAENSLFPEFSHNGSRGGTKVFMIDVRLWTCWLSPICSRAQEVCELDFPLLEWCRPSIGLQRHGRGSLTCAVTTSVCCLAVSFPVRLRGSSATCPASRGRSTMRDSSSKSQVEILSTHTLPAI